MKIYFYKLSTTAIVWMRRMGGIVGSSAGGRAVPSFNSIASHMLRLAKGESSFWGRKLLDFQTSALSTAGGYNLVIL